MCVSPCLYLHVLFSVFAPYLHSFPLSVSLCMCHYLFVYAWMYDFQSILEKINIAPLPIAAKLRTINVMTTSKLHFCFPNIHFTDKTPDKIEDATVFFARSWCSLNSSSTHAFMLCARCSGALGLFNPRIIFYAKKMSFYLSVRNSDDEQNDIQQDSRLSCT